MLHHAPRAIRTRTIAVTLTLAALACIPLPVAARETVDPATLTPAPNPAANPICGWSGSQVICRSELRFTVTAAETGIFCDGGQLLESSERHTRTTRTYNSDLLLTKRVTQEWIEGVLYVAETGEQVRWTGTDSGIATLRVPGDTGTGTFVNVGAIIHLYPAAGPSISLAGRIVEDLDAGTVVAAGGVRRGVDFCDVIA
jgi:hypothetical protein